MYLKNCTVLNGSMVWEHMYMFANREPACKTGASNNRVSSFEIDKRKRSISFSKISL